MIKYTVIDHIGREKLRLSLMEYTVADSIYQLQSNPTGDQWCRATNEYLSEWIGISVRGLQKIYERLESKKILIRSKDKKQVSQLWFNTIVSFKKPKKEIKLNETQVSNFENIWNRYPKKIGKENGMRMFQKLIKTEDEYNILSKALKNYKTSADVQNGFVMNFSNWLKDYKDWYNYKEF